MAGFFHFELILEKVLGVTVSLLALPFFWRLFYAVCLQKVEYFLQDFCRVMLAAG
jgi:hypothetical protein